MKKEGHLLEDKIDIAQSKEESKAVKYARIAFAWLGGILILAVIVAAIMRNFGG